MQSLQKLKDQTISNLLILKDQLRNVDAGDWKSYEFCLEEQDLLKIEAELKKQFKDCKVLYSFVLLNHQQEIYREYNSLKQTNGRLASDKLIKLRRTPGLSNLNVSKLNEPNDHCLYVGSSNGMARRFVNHVGIKKGNSTYSLHLRKVLHQKTWLDQVKVKLSVLDIKTDSEVIKQMLENSLYESLQPSMGKYGGK